MGGFLQEPLIALTVVARPFESGDVIGEAGANVLANLFVGTASNRGGVQVAARDVDGDGVADLITGAGPGDGTRVTALKGPTLEVLQGFDAFAGLNTGVFVG